MRTEYYFVHQPGFPSVALAPSGLNTKLSPKLSHHFAISESSFPPIIHNAPFTLRLLYWELFLLGFFEFLHTVSASAVAKNVNSCKVSVARIGRPPLTKDEIPQAFYRHYPAYMNGQLNVSELARVCDLSRTTVYKYIELLER